MNATSMVRLLKYALGFAFFACSYYLPKFLEGSVFTVTEPRARLLLGEALASSSVRWALAVNVAGHLVVLFVCFWALCWLVRAFARGAGLSPLVSGSVVFFAAWCLLISLNSVLFPLSDYSYGFAALARLEVAFLACAVLLAVLLCVAWQGVVRVRFWAVTVLCCVAFGLLGLGGLVGGAGVGGRNIVLIGVDSLSGHAFERARDELPNMRHLAGSGNYYARAYTPLGRTFPAWMSILSGKSPVDHGAWFNLRAMDYVVGSSLLSKDLQKLGYRTIFAIDERRFNNMNERFGFDAVVGPQAGALDFVLQRVNDTPLTNLLLQFPLARRLLSFSYINVASYASYDDRAFVGGVLDSLGGADKVFLAAHFESAHFPFVTRHAERSEGDSSDFWAKQLRALKVVDRQIGWLMDGLAEAGVLDDALVVLLSDHGEGLGLLEASIDDVDGLLEVDGYGHGASLLSDHQNRIILASVRFKSGNPVVSPTTQDDQVSLMDLRPFLYSYAFGEKSGLVAGKPCIFVETGIRFAAAADYRSVDKEQLAEQGAGYYEINSNGLLQLKESSLQELVDTKDIGFRCRDRLTYWSNFLGGYRAYSLREDGVLDQAVEPLEGDVREIEQYREHYLQRAKP